MHLERRAPSPNSTRGGGAVQLDVGRAEAGPVVVVVTTHLGGRLFGAVEQVAAWWRRRRCRARGHRALEQQHPVQRGVRAGSRCRRRAPAELAMLTLTSRAARAPGRGASSAPPDPGGGGHAGEQLVARPAARRRSAGRRRARLSSCSPSLQRRRGDLVDPCPSRCAAVVRVVPRGVRRRLAAWRRAAAWAGRWASTP